MKRLNAQQVDRRYIPTLGCEVTKIGFELERMQLLLNLWDTAGPEKFGGLRDGF